MNRKYALCTLLAFGMAELAHAAVEGLDAESALASADTYTVLVKTTVRYPFGDDSKGRSKGAGFVVDRKRGWILTNAHVTSRSVASIMVSFHGGEPIASRRVYVDPFLDLAILEVPLAMLPTEATEARLDCSDSPRAGIPVVAYGHPGGHLFTGTKGIISGVSSRYSSELLQTDAPINPGNSGGPLINLSTGAVAGINTASATSLQNTNFALAARYACPVLDLLRAGKNPSPPKSDWRFFTDSEEGSKVKVAHPGKFGESLGIKAGDVILSVNGGPKPKNETQVLHAMRGALNDLRISIERRGSTISLKGRAEPEPNVLDQPGLLVAGMLLTEFDKRIVREVDFKGVWVEFVDKGSEAEASEVTANTILVSVNGIPTPNLAAAAVALSTAAAGNAPAVLVFKKGGNISASGLFNWLERRLVISDVIRIRVGDLDEKAHKDFVTSAKLANYGTVAESGGRP